MSGFDASDQAGGEWTAAVAVPVVVVAMVLMFLRKKILLISKI